MHEYEQLHHMTWDSCDHPGDIPRIVDLDHKHKDSLSSLL